MMGQGMQGLSFYTVLLTMLLTALLVLAVTATVWLIRNTMGYPGGRRDESDGVTSRSGSA